MLENIIPGKADKNSKTVTKNLGKEEVMTNQNKELNAENSGSEQKVNNNNPLLKFFSMRTAPVSLTVPIYEDDLKKMVALGRDIAQATGKTQINFEDLLQMILKAMLDGKPDQEGLDKLKLKVTDGMRIDYITSKGGVAAQQ